jgi:hypothetical protein
MKPCRTGQAGTRPWHWLAAVFGLSIALVGAAPAAVPVSTGEYKLPATVDPMVATDLATELWARVWQPTSGGPYPLVVFLHGNHGTCGHFDATLGIRIDDNTEYTYSGTCPPGYVVAPSHMGYAYVAADLAAQGYVVVSINANRGVNAAPGVPGDDGLNLRRGRLVLRHLEYLAALNAGTKSPPAGSTVALLGMLDFAHLGLMGHSRGGEGMRAAVTQYDDRGSPWPALVGPAVFEGLFEIAPVDGQTSRTLNATEMAWNVLIAGCDGDVYDWEGVRVYDRMLALTGESQRLPKSTFLVWGANHNFFNSEWQESDTTSCINQRRFYTRRGGDAQRGTSYATLLDFMLAHVGPGKIGSRALSFDPSYPLNKTLPRTTTYARGFTPTPVQAANFVVDNFDRTTGTSTEGVANESHGLQTYQHGPAGASAHEPTQRAALLRWTTAGAGTWFQTNATAAGASVNVSGYPALEFRVMLQCPSPGCVARVAKGGDVDFSIALANAAGALSAPVTLKSKAVVRWPGGTFQPMEMLQTVRVPLAAFAGFDPGDFRGVRFTFDRTASRAVYVADVRLTQTPAGPGGLLASAPDSSEDPADAGPNRTPALNEINQIVAIHAHAASPERAATVEIELSSSRTFPVGGALAELRLGSHLSTLSRMPPGATDRLVFSFPADEFAAIPGGVPVSLRIGGATPWSFGTLVK